eukprot:scaffold295727_cov15-Tisochrysis_lutea.AAC.1
MGGCYFSDEGLPVAAQIDGVDGESWRLPLAPLSATSLPEPFSPGACVLEPGVWVLEGLGVCMRAGVQMHADVCVLIWACLRDSFMFHLSKHMLPVSLPCICKEAGKQKTCHYHASAASHLTRLIA